MDRGVDGRTNGRMDGCMGGWMDGYIHIEFIELYTVDTVDRIR